MWTPIPTEYLELEALTPGTKNTLWAICSFSYGDRPGCYPSQESLSRRARTSRQTISVHVRRLASLGVVIPIKQGRRYYYLLPHKARGAKLVDSIRKCLEQLSPAVHEHKSLKDFLAEERAKPKFTDRELRKVKADIKRWGDEARAKGEAERSPKCVKEARVEYIA